MKVFEDTTDYNSKQPEKDEEPEYPKEVHTMCFFFFFNYSLEPNEIFSMKFFSHHYLFNLLLTLTDGN